MNRRDFLKIVAAAPMAGAGIVALPTEANPVEVLRSGRAIAIRQGLFNPGPTQHCIWRGLHFWSRDEFVFWKPVDEQESAEYVRFFTEDTPRALIPIGISIFWYGHRETWELRWGCETKEITVIGPFPPISDEKCTSLQARHLEVLEYVKR